MLEFRNLSTASRNLPAHLDSLAIYLQKLRAQPMVSQGIDDRFRVQGFGRFQECADHHHVRDL
jgi:hypothetical protein